MHDLDATQRLEILRVAEEAARAAGQILLDHLGQIRAETIGRKSSVRDLVTAADVASERHLVSVLRKAFPEHAIEAEEEVCDAPSEGLRWFVDPLDGTVNFVHQLPCFAVSMGLHGPHGPEVGLVYLPLLNEMFTATRGGGTRLNGTPVTVSNKTTLSESLLGTGFPYRRGELTPSNLENFSELYFDVRGMRRMGSAATDLAYVAAGRLDGFWELYLSPHDVAAGGLLVQEAGGLVTEISGGDQWLRGKSIVAAGSALHGLLRPRLKGPSADPSEAS